jgi:transcriptional regulator with XRE-family HTH domain
MIAQLVAKRKLLGLTQDDLAKKLEISRNSVVRMENGYWSPTRDKLENWAKALGCVWVLENLS